MPENRQEKLFTDALLGWYGECGRRGLPWQKPDWYARMVSEVMLQQTQVATVLPKYEAFMKAFPTPQALAAASLDEVLALWAGLGYYARARHLHAAVSAVVRDFGGRCPETAEALAGLPGIGLSTAGAIAAFSFGQRAVMADGNAQRVIARVFLIPGHPLQSAFKKAVWKKAEELLPESAKMADYTQALMDFGALQCTRSPDCAECPLAAICGARRLGRVADYPGKKPRKERPVRHAAALFVFSGDALWLSRRPEEGLWGGLWMPFWRVSDEAFGDVPGVLAGLAQEAAAGRARIAASLTHDFSHFRLEIASGWAEAGQSEPPAGFRAVKLAEIGSVGLPAPIARLCEAALAARERVPSLF
jgi:A/G-specific adenine glycosylase